MSFVYGLFVFLNHDLGGSRPPFSEKRRRVPLPESPPRTAENSRTNTVRTSAVVRRAQPTRRAWARETRTGRPLGTAAAAAAARPGCCARPVSGETAACGNDGRARRRPRRSSLHTFAARLLSDDWCASFAARTEQLVRGGDGVRVDAGPYGPGRVARGLAGQTAVRPRNRRARVSFTSACLCRARTA